ncbi:MAG: fatty acid biosynthesis transcriptional regulator [Firmicutes bacterium]|nr:fatty acid biosynthesis transcriptional regulator [Bacillota bacterium]
MKKEERHAYLLQMLEENPFLKDDDLAAACNVSISTIRIDRAELGIAEYRERVKKAASGKMNNEKAEMLDLNLYQDGLAVLKTDDNMTFNGTEIIKSQSLYAFAESLALDVIDAKAALVKVANVKYIQEVHKGSRLLAKSKVVRVKENEYIVHVFIKSNMNEVFRGKFSLLVPNNN